MHSMTVSHRVQEQEIRVRIGPDVEAASFRDETESVHGCNVNNSPSVQMKTHNDVKFTMLKLVCKL